LLNSRHNEKNQENSINQNTNNTNTSKIENPEKININSDKKADLIKK
jgi:hypothetical protein